ncbi:hypothetical protein [Planctomyces sp. SH-PL14]|uniref:c-type cytochrome n=1 Tax=Planctomyces sp. SH-PL14 TaxID=1632864 RepID=UPI00078D8742|nr:hypothetical protein [Planctomyces sp. SH-PL14]AMV18356.1 hypothetical protein VT03_10730 [Planctomyces sp. SH-PL14]
MASYLPETTRPRRRRIRRWLLSGLFALVLVGGALVWEKLFHEYPQEFATTADQFKYGSIGAENSQGIPYWIWVVLPRVFPDHLPGPGGYASLGIVWEQVDPGHPAPEMPVGFSRKRIGYDRVAVNCALCHSATYRTRSDDGRLSVTNVVPGGPAGRFDPQSYLAFLRDCAQDQRFNADTLMEAISYNVKLSTLDQWLYRYVLIPGTRDALLKQSAASQWMQSRPLWGHGRIDPFNPVKFGMLEMNLDRTIGNSDMMPLWDLSSRRTRQGTWNLHWDGLNVDPLDTSLAGALGDGATRKSLPVDQIRNLQTWFTFELPPPGSPPGARAKRELIEEGRQIFARHCSDCHGRKGDRLNEVIVWSSDDPNATDDHRLKMWNTLTGDNPPRHAAAIYNDYGNGYAWDLNSFVKTEGYVATPLQGLWLRGPYLHNGSVPTLADLLCPPLSQVEQRKLILDAAVETNLTRLLVEFFTDRPADTRTFDNLVTTLKDARDESATRRLDEFLEGLRRAEISPEGASAVATRLQRLKPLVDRVIRLARERRRRPPMFYRGSDVLDIEHVGFVHDSSGVVGRHLAVPYVTLVPGNSAQGHLYGTTLPQSQKHALLEFLRNGEF